jgi:potassium channel LctB
MINAVFLFIVILSLYKSFSQLFKRHEHRNNYVSLENLIFLFMLYVNVLVGFGLVYTIFQMKGTPVIVENGVQVVGNFLEVLGTAMYFSAITLLSVGYGDITPIGLGRFFAILEALIGYIIPAAFVVRSMVDYENTP